MKAVWAANVGQDIFEAPNTSDPKHFQTRPRSSWTRSFFNVMSQDDATGQLKLSGIDRDQIDLDWKQPVAQQQLCGDIEQLLREFSSAMGGRYIALRSWQG